MTENSSAPRCLQFVMMLALILLMSQLAWSPCVSAAARSPNIIVILMDDMGWRDVGFMGNTFVETPNLDRLAKGGIVFRRSYSSAPNCAPTRACLMSGQYTPRHGIYTVVDPRQAPGSPWQKLMAADSKSELATNVVTIAERLHAGGYQTMFLGMWNLGRGRTGPVTPGGQGFGKVVFPENLGFAKDAYFNDRDEYLSDRLTDEVLKYMSENRERPFFVYLADHAVHAPYKPKPELFKKYQQKQEANGVQRNRAEYAATIEAVDQNVGRIVAELERLKLRENTLVIFTSDNGATPQFTAPLRGSKGELYEGGIRVPLVFNGVGVSSPGRSSDVPVTSVDLYPTLLDVAGLKPGSDQVLDGLSLVPILAGKSTLPSRLLFWHFPCYVGRATPSSALREGDFKLVEFFEDGGHTELYNLRLDPNEERNLATEMPDKATDLYRKLQTWQKETNATIPRTANPKYDPQAERPRGRQENQSAKNPKGGGNRGKRKSLE